MQIKKKVIDKNEVKLKIGNPSGNIVPKKHCPSPGFSVLPRFLGRLMKISIFINCRTKDEMRGKYTVQLTVAGQKFVGEADLPQAAKHNAALQV